MTVRYAYCSTCARQVALGPTDPLTCPVCSSPLVETVPTQDADSRRLVGAGPEVFLG